MGENSCDYGRIQGLISIWVTKMCDVYVTLSNSGPWSIIESKFHYCTCITQKIHTGIVTNLQLASCFVCLGRTVNLLGNRHLSLLIASSTKCKAEIILGQERPI